MATMSALLPLLTVHAPKCEDRAVFGCWVKLRDPSGRESVFRIVGPDEADAREHRLSAASPLAREVLGKQAGDTVSLDLPRGSVDYEIIDVSATPPHPPSGG